MTTELSHSEQQAVNQLESITEMVQALMWFMGDQEGDHPKIDGDTIEDEDTARERILEDALEVSVRSGWYSLNDGADCRKPAEFYILLCTGGPACRIIGELDEHGYPTSARIEHQDWGTPWTEYRVNAADEDVLKTYAQQFYFGD
jgi:hypothetical protein